MEGGEAEEKEKKMMIKWLTSFTVTKVPTYSPVLSRLRLSESPKVLGTRRAALLSSDGSTQGSARDGRSEAGVPLRWDPPLRTQGIIQ